jgi:DNA-binding transcriptional regulator YiaG
MMPQTIDWAAPQATPTPLHAGVPVSRLVLTNQRLDAERRTGQANRISGLSERDINDVWWEIIDWHETPLLPKVPTASQDADQQELSVSTSIGTKERLERIQNAFGLTLARLADVLDISRATLYTWLDQDKKINKTSRAALERLEHRAQLWAERCSFPPGTLLRSREVDGKTLEAWLKDPAASDEQLLRVMAEFAKRVEQRERKLTSVTTAPIHPASDDVRSI